MGRIIATLLQWGHAMSKHHKLSLDTDVGGETREQTVSDTHLAATDALTDQHELETAINEVIHYQEGYSIIASLVVSEPTTKPA